jgi:hypothetical protein
MKQRLPVFALAAALAGCGFIKPIPRTAAADSSSRPAEPAAATPAPAAAATAAPVQAGSAPAPVAARAAAWSPAANIPLNSMVNFSFPDARTVTCTVLEKNANWVRCKVMAGKLPGSSGAPVLVGQVAWVNLDTVAYFWPFKP